jgi:hypothetical protein
MEICSHKSCGREKRVWLPTNDYLGVDVNLHPWCVYCGVVKSISDDKAHKIGYWLNVLSVVAKRFSLKQVQKHLISKELASLDCFNDTYGISGFLQKELFKKIVKKYCNINAHSIDSFIY